jgi:Tfp pilus assembly protein PilO
MVSRSVKVRLLVWGLIATGIIIVTLSWVVEGQYAQHARDVQVLQQQLVWCSKQHILLHRMPAIKKEAARLYSLIAAAERKLPSKHLHYNAFLQAVEAVCLKNGVTCRSSEISHKSLGFYDWKQLKISLSGVHDAIFNTLTGIDRIGRLISWEDVCYRTTSEAVAVLKIFSYPSNFGHDVKPIGRREIKTKTWLLPFSTEVKNLQQEAVHAYDLLMSEPGAEEKLQFIEEFKEKKIRFERMKSVLSELDRRCASLDQAIKNLDACN